MTVLSVVHAAFLVVVFAVVLVVVVVDNGGSGDDDDGMMLVSDKKNSFTDNYLNWPLQLKQILFLANCSLHFFKG